MITDAWGKCLRSLMKTVIPPGMDGCHNLFPASESKAWKVFKGQIVCCLFSIKKSSHRKKTKERIPVRDERSRRFSGAPWLWRSVKKLAPLVSAQSDGGSLSSSNVTRLICLNRTSLDVSAGRRCHSSSASLPAAGKLETFKQDGQAALKSARRSCNAGRVWSDVRTRELTFKISLQTEKMQMFRELTFISADLLWQLFSTLSSNSENAFFYPSSSWSPCFCPPFRYTALLEDNFGSLVTRFKITCLNSLITCYIPFVREAAAFEKAFKCY